LVLIVVIINAVGSTLGNMKPIAELRDCMWDSPKFRSAMEQSEGEFEVLETKLDKVSCVGLHTLYESQLIYDLANLG
jgi:hypothetical protein